MGTQYDGGAVTDSTENTAGVICFFNNSAATAFTAPIDMTALERFASSFSKTGSPIPAGTPVT